jgi:hypothetical protein
VQQSPKRGAGPAGDPDTDEDDEVVVAVIDEGRPAARRKAHPALPADDGEEIPDGVRSWRDRHGPTVYVIGCLVVMGVLMTLQSTC